MTPALGISGRIAAYIQTAQITQRLALMALLLGGFRARDPAQRRAADQRR
jgi:hypothetical protein